MLFTGIIERGRSGNWSGAFGSFMYVSPQTQALWQILRARISGLVDLREDLAEVTVTLKLISLLWYYGVQITPFTTRCPELRASRWDGSNTASTRGPCCMSLACVKCMTLYHSFTWQWTRKNIHKCSVWKYRPFTSSFDTIYSIFIDR